MDTDMKRRVKESYLSGRIRAALEKTWLPADEIDAILEMVRRGLVSAGA